ncbi:hypothetical protein [Nocardia otitidiscaviarum]|uniref:hypothetical protein n=1 Tax=Nocardia otitidiscaviarum TaxID=1823 RepID=UPI0004A6C870|nr:hypothetical protein [Nocardia otitidiscaviarum]
MSLADDLAAQPTAQEPEYRPRTEYDAVTGGFIQTGALHDPPASYIELLRQFGYDPDEVQIVGHPRVSRWQTYDERWLAAYRFRIAPRRPDSNLGELIARIDGWAAHQPAVSSGPHVFNLQCSDLQIAKADNGGTDTIVDKFLDTVDRAVREYRVLQIRGVAGVHILFPGDCIEGNVSQDGRNWWRTEYGVTTQTRILRRLMLHTIEQFAPLTDTMWVSVVNGNHDQAQRFQNTNPGDGWATECAISVADALKMNEAAFGHVSVEVPDPEQGFMTVARGDTVFTIAHGHQWKGGATAKHSHAFTWWSDQAFHQQNPAGAHILAHGHFHSWAVETAKTRTRICSPTFDGGSNYYRDLTGAEARRGGLVYLTRAGEISAMSLV